MFKTLEDFIDTGIKCIFVDGRLGFTSDGRARLGDHVARDFDIDRLGMAQAACQGACDVRRGAGCVVELDLLAGDFLEHLELRIECSGLMVQEQPGARFALARPAGENDQRRFFGIRRGNGVDHVQRAGAIGDGGDAQPHVGTRRSIGSKADGRFVRQGIERQYL